MCGLGFLVVFFFFVLMLTAKVKIHFFLLNGTEHNDYLSLIFQMLSLQVGHLNH